MALSQALARRRTHNVDPNIAGLGMGQNETTRGPQVLVLGSIYRGFILGTYF